jgi:hypothetical protein
MALAGLLLTLLCVPIGAAYGAALRQDIPTSYQAVAENEAFRLYVDFSTLAFKLLDKRSDYLWHSGIDELQEGDRLNRSWQAFARSGISIEYLDKKAINARASIANANHTLNVTPIDQGIWAQVTFQDYGISVGVEVQLEAGGVRVEIPFESIREDNPDFRLGQVYVYPFLGATRGSSIPGYMFVPDGIGSLIRFADSTKARNMMYGRYYGPDLGMLAVQPYDERVTAPYTISFPVFGIVHGEGQNAFFSVVETGAAYGEVQAHPAGIITNFNFLYNAFIYNETYFQATNRSGAGVTTIQRQTNAFDAVIHYRFLTGDAASYVGMARGYQQYLLDKGLLRRQVIDNPNIGIRLEFLGGDKEKILFWNRFIPMTTIGQMRDILANLELSNPEVIYFGWQPLGASSMPPASLVMEGSLGSLSDLQALTEDIAAGGGRFSLYYDPLAALWQEPGYSALSDLAMAITKEYLLGFNRYVNHYFTLETLQRRYTELSSNVTARLNVGLALDSIGSILYSDYRDRTPFNREQAIAAYRALLSESPARLGLYRPNDYLFGIAQAYYDMPPGSNGYIFTSEPVPFLPIVLAGYMPYYGTALNFSSNRQEDLLRHIEFGIYPSYFLTHEPTANMLNTHSSWIYTSSYAQWGDEIRQTYQWMNGLLAPVRGQEIVAHAPLAEGVFATTYASGSQIVVNYTDQPFTYRGITLAAKDAALVETGS